MMRGFAYGPAMMGGYSPWADLLVLMFWLFILAGVVVLVVWAVRQMMRHDATPAPPPGSSQVPPADEAMTIARKRLASGEITREQFEDIRQALGG